ncbi:chaplin [Streptomyces bluensis]|uniref:chaplin n=1 Tax=Streptomyces bluensis TaxID=33897 RepID=UPI00332409A0
MRQTLSKGMVAAAAATGILSLYNTSALADSSAQGAAEGSAGVLSGNTVQAPVHIPINVCGNTVEIVGVGNAAFGNSCANEYKESKESKSRDASRHADSEGEEGKGARGPESLARGGSQQRGASEERTTSDKDEPSGASARGVALGSPGIGSIGSGNVIQAPVELPVNICGNTGNVLALLNGTFGSKCANEAPPKDQANPPEDYPDSPDAPETPDAPDTDKPRHQPPTSRVTPSKPPTTSVDKPSVTPSAMAETGTEGVLAASAASAVLIAGGALLYRRSRTASRR